MSDYPFDWAAEDDLDRWEAEWRPFNAWVVMDGVRTWHPSDDRWLRPWPRFRFLCPWRRRTQ